ncbi:hypothetical protein D3C81_2226230 [compost metagenome]
MVRAPGAEPLLKVMRVEFRRESWLPTLRPPVVADTSGSSDPDVPTTADGSPAPRHDRDAVPE